MDKQDQDTVWDSDASSSMASADQDTVWLRMHVTSLEADKFSGLLSKGLLLLGQHALLHINSIVCWRPVRWGSLPCICFGCLAVCSNASEI